MRRSRSVLVLAALAIGAAPPAALDGSSTHQLSARALLKTRSGQPAIHRTVRVKFTICG